MTFEGEERAMPALVAIEVTLPPCAPMSAPLSEQPIAPGRGQNTVQSAEPGCEPPDVGSMLEACNAALSNGACVDASTGVDAEQLAKVNVTGNTTVTVEVRTARTDSAPTVRVLEFNPADEPRERWRTVGFTTALLVEGRAPQKPEPEPKLEPKLKLIEAPAVGLVTARLVGASGFGARSPKAGGHLALAGRAWAAPLFVGVFAEYTTSSWATKEIAGDATWGEVGLGITFVVDLADDLELFLHVGGLAQRLAIIGQKKAEVAEASLWQPGVRGGADLTWPLYARWYGVLGAQVTGVVSPVELRVEDKVKARAPALGGGVNIGIQYRF
jgi:hypothetical protein